MQRTADHQTKNELNPISIGSNACDQISPILLYAMAEILIVGDDTIALCDVNMDHIYRPKLYLPCMNLQQLGCWPDCQLVLSNFDIALKFHYKITSLWKRQISPRVPDKVPPPKA